MTVAYVSLTLTGGVRLVSQSKNLTKKEIELRIEDANQNPPTQWTNKKFLECPNYTNDITSTESTCVQKINISNTLMKSILNGTSLPSETLLRANGLKVNVKGKWVFNNKKWNAMSDYAKLHMFFEDHRVDAGAVSHTIHFIA